MIVCLLLTNNLKAQSITDSIFVKGNCEHCKDRIESTVMSNKGISSATWYPEYNRLVCVYDTTIIKNAQIQKSIVDIGHDTHYLRANDQTYKSLPSCCKYERDPVLSEKSNLAFIEFSIDGMTCEDGCAKGIVTNIFRIQGVKFVEVNYETKRAKVIYNKTKVEKLQIQQAVETFKSLKDEQNVYKVIYLY